MPKPSPRIVTLFGLTMFVSAALLFDIQPMYAKMLLPLVGGAPSVWNTVVVFFQVGLLAGYLLAHVLRTYLPLKVQVVAHIVLAALAILVLPFRTVVANSNAIADPVPFVLLTLLAGAGLPFLAISATSPLLQSWFARIGHAHSRDPYFFYSASNAGSLAGLAAYPLLLEPFLSVGLQSRIWTVAYCVLVTGLIGCGFVAWRFGTSAVSLEAVAAEPDDAPPTWAKRLRWIGLAFVPASLSLAMTTHITNEVAAIPLLWTLPLGIYLLTFIIAFSRRPVLTPERIARVLPYAILPLALLVMLGGVLPAYFDVAFNLVALFLIALACHGELSASRPSAKYLTGFYLVLAAGGASGGLFNALISPYVFRTIAEYPLTLVLACAILPALGVVTGSLGQRVFDYVAPALLGVAMLGSYALVAKSLELGPWMRVGFSLAAIVCFAFVGRRIRFALGMGVLFGVAALLPSQIGYRLDVSRNFFGTKLTVEDPRQRHAFIHSGTIHGIENTELTRRSIPLAYYSKDGPLGSIFAAARSSQTGTRDVGVVGLGVGSIACYRMPGENWTFFEIDPQVVSLAENTKLFWYLSSCAPAAQIVVGDGRLELAKVPAGAYGLLVLDAYSSDQPPLHMLTKEAFDVFTSRVAPGGFIAFHISNRYFNLAPIVGNLAASVGWEAWIDRDNALTAQRVALGEMPSQWVVVARRSADAGSIATDPRWHHLVPDPRLRLWTDDYSSLLLVMHG